MRVRPKFRGVWKNLGMALGYLRVDRDQPFLLPPDVREWLDEGHLVWLVLDVVERIDTSALHAGRRLGAERAREVNPHARVAPASLSRGGRWPPIG